LRRGNTSTDSLAGKEAHEQNALLTKRGQKLKGREQTKKILLREEG